VRLLYQVLEGSDESAQNPMPVSDFVNPIDLRGSRAAWYTFDGVSPVTEETRLAVQSAAHALESTGIRVREEKPPTVEHGHELWSALFARAALMQMRTEYAKRENEAGEFVGYLLSSSKDAPTAALDEFARAWDKRNKLRTTLLEWMKSTPLIIAPVGTMPAFEHGARRVDIKGQTTSIFRAFSYAQVYNVFDLPVACVPAGLSSEGLPIGVQIIGRPFAEMHVLAAAKIVESVLGGWRMPLLAC
jgi:Asp-tRNA(Asn)/Glu-tRNA(Gln) amidotransferase A subunit family amidase